MGAEFFSKAFSASIEMIVWFLCFNLLVWCITLIAVYVDESLHPWNKPDLIMVYELFNMLLNSVC